MEKLKYKEFQTKEELVKWANGKTGTDWIVAINIEQRSQSTFFVLWYIQ